VGQKIYKKQIKRIHHEASSNGIAEAEKVLGLRKDADLVELENNICA
jgi:hypothetical protein